VKKNRPKHSPTRFCQNYIITFTVVIRSHTLWITSLSLDSRKFPQSGHPASRPYYDGNFAAIFFRSVSLDSAISKVQGFELKDLKSEIAKIVGQIRSEILPSMSINLKLLKDVVFRNLNKHFGIFRKAISYFFQM
jgi:hypothetical protein